MSKPEPNIRAAASSAVGSATQQAYHAIRARILTGDLPPGQKLKIDRLRDLVQTGASPIREALSLLTSDHLVERIDQRGFRTAPVSGEDFRDILELRCVLEARALRESIARATPDWEEALVLAHHRMARSPRGDVDRFEAHHKTFHMELLRQSPSPVLLKFCGQLYDLNIRYRYLAGRALTYGARDVSQEHADILDAAVARDADRASDLLLHHYRATGAYLAEVFDAV